MLVIMAAEMAVCVFPVDESGTTPVSQEGEVVTSRSEVR